MQDQVEINSPRGSAKPSWQEPFAVMLGTAYAAVAELFPLESILYWALMLVIVVILVSSTAIQAFLDKRSIPWRKTIRNVLLVPVMMAAGVAIALLIRSDWFQALFSWLPPIPSGVIENYSLVVFGAVVIGFLVHMFITEEIGKQLRNPLNLAFIAAALILLAALFFIARAIV